MIKEVSITVVIIVVISAVMASFLTFDIRVLEGCNKYKNSDQCEKCEEKGGIYLTGGFGTPRCDFPSN